MILIGGFSRNPLKALAKKKQHFNPNSSQFEGKRKEKKTPYDL